MTLLDAARRLPPLHQGQLDSLCGLYAILNAVQLALAPTHTLTRAQLAALFGFGIKALDRAGQLSRVLRTGLSERAWMRLTNGMVKRASALAGVELKRVHLLRGLAPGDRTQALQRIIDATDAGAPVLVMLRDDHAHYSVVVGHTLRRLVLFNSAGLRWMALRTCGLDHAQPVKRHQISRRSAIALLRA